jgi:hypothetical protein
MKINVVRNNSGKIVASYEAAGQGAVSLTPVLKDGERVEEMDVPANYRDNLALLYAGNGNGK